MSSNGQHNISDMEMIPNECPGHSHGISYPGHRANDFNTLISNSASKTGSACDQKRIENTVENYNCELAVSHDFEKYIDHKNSRFHCSQLYTPSQCENNPMDSSVNYQRNFQYPPKMNELQLLQVLERKQQEHFVLKQNLEPHSSPVKSSQFDQYENFESNNHNGEKFMLTHHVPLEEQEICIADLPIFRRAARTLDSSLPQQNLQIGNNVCWDRNDDPKIGFLKAQENISHKSRKSFPLFSHDISKQHLRPDIVISNFDKSSSSTFRKSFPLTNICNNEHTRHNNTVSNIDVETFTYDEKFNIQNALPYSEQNQHSEYNIQSVNSNEIKTNENFKFQQQETKSVNMRTSNIFVDEKSVNGCPYNYLLYPNQMGKMESNGVCSPLSLIRQYSNSQTASNLMDIPQFNQSPFNENGNTKCPLIQKNLKQSTPYSDMPYANYRCNEHSQLSNMGTPMSIIRDNDYSRTYEIPLFRTYPDSFHISHHVESGTQNTTNLLRDESVSRTIDSPCSMTLETPVSHPYQVKNPCNQNDLLPASASESNKSSDIWERNRNFFEHTCLICNISFGSILKYIEHQEDYDHLKNVYKHFKLIESSSFLSSRTSNDREGTAQSSEKDSFEISVSDLSNISIDDEIVNDSDTETNHLSGNILNESESSSEFLTRSSVALSNNCLTAKEEYDNDSSRYSLLTDSKKEKDDSAYLGDKSMTDSSVVLTCEKDNYPLVSVFDKSDCNHNLVKFKYKPVFKQLHYSADVSHANDSTSTEYSSEDNAIFGNASLLPDELKINYHTSENKFEPIQKPLHIGNDLKVPSAGIINKIKKGTLSLKKDQNRMCDTNNNKLKVSKNIIDISKTDSSAYFADVSQTSNAKIIKNGYYIDHSIKNKQIRPLQNCETRVGEVLQNENITSNSIGENNLSSIGSNKHTKGIYKPSELHEGASCDRQLETEKCNDTKLATISGIFSCELCNIRCFGYANYQLHLKGEKHSKKIKRLSLDKSNFVHDSTKIFINKHTLKVQKDLKLSYRTCEKPEALGNTVNSLKFEDKITRDLEEEFEQCLDTQSQILGELTIKSTSEECRENSVVATKSSVVVDKESYFCGSSNASTLKDQTLEPSLADLSIENSNTDNSLSDTLVNNNSLDSINSPLNEEFMDLSALSSLQPEAASTANSRFFMKNSSKMSVPQIILRNHRFIDSPNFARSNVISENKEYNYNSKFNKTTTIAKTVPDSELYTEDSNISTSWLTAATSPHAYSASPLSRSASSLSYTADNSPFKTFIDNGECTGYHITTQQFSPAVNIEDKTEADISFNTRIGTRKMPISEPPQYLSPNNTHTNEIHNFK